ncbi:hypothetical protein [Nitrosovibrio sp. Nv17]|uniref:hypothetical protein n=1 Tax=Nitrosovibrio sp. Nv17 TaxID=1855339 RepID=UPI0009090052|nr:hypothetical protein [Nitrosovibrio sp. Nv17]SFW26008.1 hypothetical protein SAMN05216414_10960 [Nitrosovibrio sp. Nv17]
MYDTDVLERPWRVFPKEMEAACYNRGHLAIIRLGAPVRVALQRHRGLEVILERDVWLCVDSYAEDQPVLAWRTFQTRERTDLHRPVGCELWLYHSCAGLVMGSALEDLHQVLEKLPVK